jgi:hypothetical protein
VPTAANRAPHRSQDPQHGADDQQDDPSVLRIATSAMKPMTSRTNPRMSMLLSPPARPYASCAEDLADRTLIVPDADVSIGMLH